MDGASDGDDVAVVGESDGDDVVVVGDRKHVENCGCGVSNGHFGEEMK